jgi:hypothetical protein
VREDPDMPDDDVRKLIAVAAAMLITDPSPTPKAEPAAKPKATKGKVKPAEPQGEDPAITAARKACAAAREAYTDECREQGVPERPWLDIARDAIGKPWDTAKSAHGVEDYEKLAAAYETEIDRVRRGDAA